MSYLSNWLMYNGSYNTSIITVDSSPSYPYWNEWDAGQRDLFILDSDGNLQYHQNITGGISNSIYNLVEELISASSMIEGDVNADSNVDVLDVVAIINMILGLNPPSDIADINGDGDVNVIDAVTLVNIILN